MRACSQEQERQLRVVLIPSHQPVGLDVTFPYLRALVNQFVRSILGGQGAGSPKQGDGIQNHLNVKPPLAAAFQVFLEVGSVVNAIHGSCGFC